MRLLRAHVEPEGQTPRTHPGRALQEQAETTKEEISEKEEKSESAANASTTAATTDTADSAAATDTANSSDSRLSGAEQRRHARLDDDWKHFRRDDGTTSA